MSRVLSLPQRPRCTRPRAALRTAALGAPLGLRVVAAALLLAALGSAARAGTIQVFPDPGNGPIAAALAQLQDGDKLILNAGAYDERITLNGLSKVKLLGKGEVVFDAVGPSATISVSDCDRILIKGLSVLNAPSQGLLVNTSEKVVIRDCNIDGHLSQGIFISASTQVKVLECSVSGGSNGIYVTGASSAKIRGNSVSGSGAQGIFVVLPSLPGTQVLRNVVSGAGNAAIELAGPGNRADKNEISDCLFGVVTPFAGGDMAGSRIARNTIVDTLVPLRTYSSGGLLISGNVVENAGASVLQIASNAEDVIATRNKADGANSGIDDEGTGSVVSRNALANTAIFGIRARGAAGTFERNTIHDTPGDGFNVWTGGNSFSRNKASGNAGVDLESSVAESENTFFKNSFGTLSFN